MTGSTLSLRNLSVARGGRPIVTGITADIADRQIVAVAGLNGAGKSTLLAAIAGQIPCDGTLTWNNRPVQHEIVGYMPQSTAARTSLSVLETVLLGRFDRLGWRIRRADMFAASCTLDALGLLALAARPLDTLSGGQQQLVMLAQRLVRAPRLLILDEATSALDLRHQMCVLGHLRSYVERSGALVLIAIHDLNLAARHADRMLVLSHGQLVAFGPSSAVLDPCLLRRHFGVEADVQHTAAGHPVIVPIAAA